MQNVAGANWGKCKLLLTVIISFFSLPSFPPYVFSFALDQGRRDSTSYYYFYFTLSEGGGSDEDKLVQFPTGTRLLEYKVHCMFSGVSRIW